MSSGRPPSENIDRLATSYLAFLAAALNPETGRFRNFMSHGRQWLEDSGSEDSHARALWAARHRCGPLAQSRATGGFRRSSSSAACPWWRPSPPPAPGPSRCWASTSTCARFPDHAQAKLLREDLTARLVRLWNGCATEDWPWFESSATYDNARLCQALFISGRGMANPEALEIALKSLGWLISVQKTQKGHFRPIGSNGFYVKGGARAYFDQQPVEAQSMVSACLAAYRTTRDDTWLREAKRAFEWFLGRNDLGLPLYDSSGGGCSDGLHPDRVSENQGAESTLAFHLALAEMNVAAHAIAPAPTYAP